MRWVLAALLFLAASLAEPAETWTLAEWLAMDDERALALVQYEWGTEYERALVYADGTPIFFRG